jgi:hypothetical protein
MNEKDAVCTAFHSIEKTKERTMKNIGLWKRPFSIPGYVILAVLLSLCSQVALHAESVFLKDGKIVDGTIVQESDAKITLEDVNNIKKEYQRKDIIRILFHGDFKDKRFMTKMDGTVLQVHVVDENRTSYTYRLVLDSAEEVTISKDDVDSISKRKIPPSAADKPADGKKEEGSTVFTSASLLRISADFSAGSQAGGSAESMAPIKGITADVIFFRTRNESGNGFDFLVRGGAGLYDVTKPSKIGYPTPAGYTLSDSSSMTQLSAGIGGRYIYGGMLLGFLCQGYVMGYYQYSSVDLYLDYESPAASDGGYEYNYTSHGFVGGVGLEIAVFKYMGLFVEYTNGYSPAFAKKTSIESGTVRAGLTLRTPLL